MRKHILSLFFFLVISLYSFAQAERITTINGKKYIIHTVESGNTLYSISKSYAVDEYFILQENSFLRDGIKVGQEIKIPLARQSKVESKVAPKINGDVLLHEVQKKETLYSLSRKYGIEINDIIRLNPEVSGGLKVGQMLKIPADKSTDTQSEYLMPAKSERMLQEVQQTHVVQAKETLYSLAKQYGVTMNDIIDANGGLKEGLQVGKELIIPKRGATNKRIDTPQPVSGGNGNKETGSVFRENYLDESPVNPGFSGFIPSAEGFLNEYKIAILLPFMVEEQAEKESLGNNQVALDFYQGALVAIDSLRKMGMNLKVLVYDTKKDPERVKTLLNSPALRDVNLFIGPMYRSVLLPVIEHAESFNSHVVCPVPQSNKVLFNHPNVSKVQTSEIAQAALLGKYMATKHPNDNIIVFSKGTKDQMESRLEQSFKGSYFKYLPGGSIFGNDTLKTIITNGYDFPDISKHLDGTRTNLIFTPSSDPVMAAGLLTYLKGFSSSYNIRVFGLEKWLSMDKIDSKNKNDLKLTVCSGQFVDYDNVNTKQFIKKYRSSYSTDPSTYGYLGFDISYYYLKGLMENGLIFLSEFKGSEFDPTSTKFTLIRLAGTSGFENKAAFILGHNNYKIEVLN